MAYGKDQKNLSVVDRFHRANAAANKRAAPKRRGPPYFVDMYRPSQVVADVIRLVPGKYEQEMIVGDGDDAQLVRDERPFISWVEHYDGPAQKGAICSAGAWSNFKDKRQPCIGCEIFWSTVTRNSEGRLESTRMSRQNKFSFSVFDYGIYHKMTQVDAQGQVKVSDKTGQPFYNWEKCAGPGCQGCQQNVESKQGNMTHWPMNFSQKEVLVDAQRTISHSCLRCGTRGSIVTLNWGCASCGLPVIDPSTSTFKADEVQKILGNVHRCRECGQEGALREEFSCSVCAQRGQEGVQASLFDVDLEVKVLQIVQQKMLQITGFSNPGAPDPRFAQFMKPVDLLARYAPDSIDEQKKKFNYVPQAPVVPASQLRQPVTSAVPAMQPMTGIGGVPQGMPSMPQMQPIMPPPIGAAAVGGKPYVPPHNQQ